MPAVPDGVKLLGELPAEQHLNLTIALQPQDPVGLQAFATAVSTPGSPDYRQYLTVPEFAHRFGATQAAIAAVTEALRLDGLTVGAPTANDLTLPVTGSAARVESAFQISEERALVGGRDVYLDTRAPVLASSVAADVQGVLGLDDVTVPQPAGLGRNRARTASLHLAPVPRRPSVRRAVSVARELTPPPIGSGPAPCDEASSFAATFGGYTADEIASMYGIGSYYPADEGAGQTVALIEFGPYQASDVSRYQACYRTSTTVNQINVDGGPGPFENGGNDLEETLDIEQIIGLAPQATIDVYQAPSNSNQADLLEAIASQDLAGVVSDSWGSCESRAGQPQLAADNTVLQELAAQGQSFFVASGDSGSTDCYQATAGGPLQNDTLSVDNPSAQPFATSVGGTLLGTISGTTWSLSENGTYPEEYVWNEGGGSSRGLTAWGSGGGVSDQWQMPGYQSGAAGSLGVVQAASSSTCGGSLCREVPDVSADADQYSPYVIYSEGEWDGVFGTSASAPLWAAFTALADASPACHGQPLGFENPALYYLAGSAYATDFHDITQNDPLTAARGESGYAGNDTWGGQNASNPDGLYPVEPGYDMATGLGSPIAGALGPGLCALRATVSVTDPGAQTSTVGKQVALALNGSDSNGEPLSWSASGLPAGLTISAAGVISGTPSTPQTSTVTVTASDGVGNADSIGFAWAVLAAPAPTTPPTATPPTTTPPTATPPTTTPPTTTTVTTTTPTRPATTTVTTAPTVTTASATRKPTPVDSTLRLSPGVLKRGVTASKGGSLTIAYADSQASLTTFTVSKRVSGYSRNGRTCTALKTHQRRPAHSRACTAAVKVGSFIHQDRVGANRVAFNGRLRGHLLAAGAYELQASPTLDGVHGKQLTVRFTVK